MTDARAKAVIAAFNDDLVCYCGRWYTPVPPWTEICPWCAKAYYDETSSYHWQAACDYGIEFQKNLHGPDFEG